MVIGFISGVWKRVLNLKRIEVVMMERAFQLIRKPTSWTLGGLALLFLPMTIIMTLMTSESYGEFKEDLIGFHKSFFN